MTPKLVDIIKVEPTVKYWFIRTDSGEHFNTYFENNFIAIGWNEISVTDLRTKSPAEVKEKIAKSRDLNLADRKGRSKTTDIYNKLIRFSNLKKGDVIVIPSLASENLAFGVIEDEDVYSEAPGKLSCDHAKRRKIRWLRGITPIDSLDPTFYKIKKSRHSISSIDAYSTYVENVIYNLYEKSGESNFVIKINTTDPINWLKLSGLLQDIHHLMELANAKFSLNENVEGSVRLNLQSPGLLNLIQKGKALLLTAIIIGASGCNPKELRPQEQKKLEEFQIENRETIDRVLNTLDTFDAGI